MNVVARSGASAMYVNAVSGLAAISTLSLTFGMICSYDVSARPEGRAYENHPRVSPALKGGPTRCITRGLEQSGRQQCRFLGRAGRQPQTDCGPERSLRPVKTTLAELQCFARAHAGKPHERKRRRKYVAPCDRPSMESKPSMATVSFRQSHNEAGVLVKESDTHASVVSR